MITDYNHALINQCCCNNEQSEDGEDNSHTHTHTNYTLFHLLVSYSSAANVVVLSLTLHPTPSTNTTVFYIDSSLTLTHATFPVIHHHHTRSHFQPEMKVHHFYIQSTESNSTQNHFVFLSTKL